MNIPFVDLKKQYESIKTEIDAAIQNVINDTAFIKGKYVQKFEKEYGDKIDSFDLVCRMNRGYFEGRKGYEKNGHNKKRGTSRRTT